MISWWLKWKAMSFFMFTEKMEKEARQFLQACKTGAGYFWGMANSKIPVL